MEHGFYIADWQVKPRRDRIERGSEVVHLAPKAMAVLLCLARASGKVVTRHELFEAVWPGSEVSDDALTQRVVELRKAFGDSARQSQVIETIPKVGFRLVSPVRPFSRKQGLKPRHPVWWAAVFVLCVLVVWFAVNRSWINSQESRDVGYPSIAVLPFINMSPEPENVYFSEGVSEEILNVLANVPGLHVISRSSSFSLKGKNLKIADMGRELNASLILEGTVRKSGNRVRITAQLIEVESDKHLWSNSYDRELSEIFIVQEEIAQSIVTAMQDEIGTYTLALERPTDNIEAYELFLLGRHRFYQRGPTLDHAIRVLRLAAERDPGFAQAWAYLAAAASVTWGYQTVISDEEAHLLAEEASAKALELEPDLGLALAVQASLAYGYSGDLVEAFNLFDLAIQSDPNDTTIRLWAGVYNHHWGYFENALTHLGFAFSHNPHVGITNGCLGLLYLAQDREQLAKPYLSKAGELGWVHHYHAEASQLMMRGEFDSAFAYLKFSITGPDSDMDSLNWVNELEEAGRAYITDPNSADTLAAVVDRAPGGIWQKTYLSLIFDLKDRFFDYFSRIVGESHGWNALMRIVWLPEYNDYVEDPRFFEIMRGDGAVALWKQRGYPDGCVRKNDSDGDHLECTQRFAASQ